MPHAILLISRCAFLRATPSHSTNVPICQGQGAEADHDVGDGDGTQELHLATCLFVRANLSLLSLPHAALMRWDTSEIPTHLSQDKQVSRHYGEFAPGPHHCQGRNPEILLAVLQWPTCLSLKQEGIIGTHIVGGPTQGTRSVIFEKVPFERNCWLGPLSRIMVVGRAGAANRPLSCWSACQKTTVVLAPES